MPRRKRKTSRIKPKAKPSSPPKLSPILRSSFEVLEHSLWHFFRSTTSTDMKFALLHLDQSIELLLKERVRSARKSIYKNPKETISIWGAYNILEQELGCNIPEKADLELLHEERNSIQHKSANPSAEDAAFHIDRAIHFINRFVKDELNLNLRDYISSEYIDQILSS